MDSTSNMAESRWFTRGWTLQELIAPAKVRFYDKSWSVVGMKDTLGAQLSCITGIGPGILAPGGRDLRELLGEFPISHRMAWAATRKTTRIEDMAYSLIGIFGVNLSLVYGEGERAFNRLQEEMFKIKAQLRYYPSKDLYALDLNCCHSADSSKRLGIFLKHQGANNLARAKPHLFVFIDQSTRNMDNDRSILLSKQSKPGIAQSSNEIHRRAIHLPAFYPTVRQM